MRILHVLSVCAVLACIPCVTFAQTVTSSSDSFVARPPIHALNGTSRTHQGMSPADVKTAYHLPVTGGSGTIAIITAFHHPDIENDLARFDTTFSMASCTLTNKCLEIHSMSTVEKHDAGWDMESALDSEWSHAIAPKAKILVVEAASDSGPALLHALDYATSRKDVVSVSMSWGGNEFPTETSLESHFSTKTNSKRAFFASSGDDGTGVSWPAASPSVVSVGGTLLTLNKTTLKSGKISTTVRSELAWSGSGGGVSRYEYEPAYQSGYSIPRAENKRAVPDVAYAADPTHGFSVFHAGSWYVIGGTSAGAPQWAAIHAIGKTSTLVNLYRDKASVNTAMYFRDIVSGSNGDCSYYCSARKRYDYVTGLGSPLTWKF